MEKKKETKKTGRVDRYFKKYMDLFVFDELSPAHLKREGLEAAMGGVAVPFRQEQLSAFGRGDGLRITDMVENMTWVLGMDPDFIYLPEYKAYMEHYFKNELADGVVSAGMRAAEEGNLESAAIHFRGALALQPDHRDALYGYARICRQIYLEAGQAEGLLEDKPDEEYVGRFKAESMESFEELTLRWPDFGPPYYFLGYAYLNMGLYRKAQLTWKEYLKYGEEEETRQEVEERMKQLSDPVEIEEGCNAVVAGRWEEGIRRLEPFLSSDYHLWWPLYYYLGIAYGKMGRLTEAEEKLKEALTLEPSQTDCMEELAEVYKELGNAEKEEKYRRKMELMSNEPQ